MDHLARSPTQSKTLFKYQFVIYQTITFFFLEHSSSQGLEEG